MTNKGISATEIFSAVNFNNFETTFNENGTTRQQIFYWFYINTKA
jgi:hypothetical protein